MLAAAGKEEAVNIGVVIRRGGCENHCVLRVKATLPAFRVEGDDGVEGLDGEVVACYCGGICERGLLVGEVEGGSHLFLFFFLLC